MPAKSNSALPYRYSTTISIHIKVISISNLLQSVHTTLNLDLNDKSMNMIIVATIQTDLNDIIMLDREIEVFNFHDQCTIAKIKSDKV